MNTTTKTLLALGLLSALPITLLADALADTNSQTLSPWQIRARMIDVAPTGSSSTITGLGGQVNDISSDTVPELDISYFFSDHVSAELILATSKHDVTATGTSVGNVDLGNVRIRAKITFTHLAL